MAETCCQHLWPIFVAKIHGQYLFPKSIVEIFCPILLPNCNDLLQLELLMICCGKSCWPNQCGSWALYCPPGGWPAVNSACWKAFNAKDDWSKNQKRKQENTFKNISTTKNTKYKYNCKGLLLPGKLLTRKTTGAKMCQAKIQKRKYIQKLIWNQKFQVRV